MNFKDIFWLGYKDLKEKKVRTALTIVMVMIGVAAIIALVSQTQGISSSISSIIGAISLFLGVVAGISLLVAAIGIMNVPASETEGFHYSYLMRPFIYGY